MTLPCGSGAEVVVCVVVKVAAAVLQIETNRNTALTLACFQGRHEVVGLLCQRGGNVEHRAKVGGVVFCYCMHACACVCVCVNLCMSLYVVCVPIADWSNSANGGCLRWLP